MGVVKKGYWKYASCLCTSHFDLPKLMLATKQWLGRLSPAFPGCRNGAWNGYGWSQGGSGCNMSLAILYLWSGSCARSFSQEKISPLKEEWRKKKLARKHAKQHPSEIRRNCERGRRKEERLNHHPGKRLVADKSFAARRYVFQDNLQFNFFR